MGSGIIQIVSNSGVEDLYLTFDPQITFYKAIYKRYTNFAVECKNQFFDGKPDFGERVTCTISKHGDLIQQIYLIVTIPNIPIFYNEDQTVNEVYKFKWIKKLGYGLINTIELDIGGKIIDKHYGDYMNIWYELTVGLNKRRGLDKMIGNIEELTDFSNGKNAYTLRIPLNFFFCIDSGLSLPLIAMQYSTVKIHVEFNDFNKCCVIGPTHSLVINESMVIFEKYELIRQVINNVECFGIYMNYDILTKSIQYIPVNASIPFQAPDTLNPAFDYSIIGTSSIGVATPKINSIQTKLNIPSVSVSLQGANLLVNYVYLDKEERLKFAKSNHEYLITQVQMLGDRVITNTNNQIKLGFIHPSKEIIFRVQMSYLLNGNNTFNYTNLYVDGTNLIKNVTLLFNGEERFGQVQNDYCNLVEVYKYHTNSPSDGVNVISFSLKPEDFVQPTGGPNLSKIDDAVLQFSVDSSITYLNTAILRVYNRNWNVLRIINGICAIAFKN